MRRVRKSVHVTECKRAPLFKVMRAASVACAQITASRDCKAMNEIQNDKEEKNVPYCHKPVGEDRWIRYTKENSLKKNYGKYCHCSHTFKRESKCVLCGDNFKHQHENRPRYCSYRCQSDAAMIAVKVARLKKRTSATTSCPSCGQVFSVAKRGRIRRFCSNKCRQRAHRVVTKCS